ncbi:MAG TPA: hypothetical protein VGN42_25780 [Pirellulales bacterium]|jgi:hypothetical protein|nr:hypothetical protein [Pirellulales bacterium]
MNAITVQHEASIFERLLVEADSAQALLSMRFPAEDEDRMRKLMEKNNQGTIGPEELAEMEAFRQVGAFLAIAQAKARLRLKSVNGNPADAE